jgi:virulence-associated protein VapD
VYVAIIFDLNLETLSEQFDSKTSSNAYKNIKNFMESNNFSWQQNSLYFGNENINAVTCVTTIQKLATTYPWFGMCAKNVQMLRIEEKIDLLPALSV